VRQFATNEAAVAAAATSNGAAVADTGSTATTTTDDSALPQGWELKYTSAHRPYYVSYSSLPCNF
jgi:hypothetical protein